MMACFSPKRSPLCFRQQWPHFLAEPLSRSSGPLTVSVENRSGGPRPVRSLKVSTPDLRFDWPFARPPLASRLPRGGTRAGEWRERDHGQVPEHGARACDRDRNRPGGFRSTAQIIDLLTLSAVSAGARLVEA